MGKIMQTAAFSLAEVTYTAGDIGYVFSVLYVQLICAFSLYDRS